MLPAPQEPGRREEGPGGGGARLRAAGRAPLTLVCEAQPGARAALGAGAGPPPAGRVGGGPRRSRPAPPSAPPPPRSPAPARAGPARPQERRGAPSASPEDGAAPRRRPRPVSARVLSPAAAAASEHARSRAHSNTQTHSCDAGALRTPHGEVALPGLPGPFLFLPQRGAWSSGGWLSCCVGRGWGARPRDGEGQHETGRTPGWGLRAGVSGRVPRIPAGSGGERSGLGRFRPRPLPPVGRTSPAACSAWAAASWPFLSRFNDTGAHSLLALFLCFPLESPRPQRDRPCVLAPPHSSGPQAPALAPRPALPRGLSPQRVGAARGKRKAKAAGRRRSAL